MKYKSMKAKKVLVIEDQVSAMVPIVMILKNLNLDVHCAFSYSDFENAIVREKYDYYIVDWNVPPNTGEEMILVIEKYLENFYSGGVSKLFVYSGRDMSTQTLPNLKRLRYCGHWKKEKNISHLVKQVSQSLIHKNRG